MEYRRRPRQRFAVTSSPQEQQMPKTGPEPESFLVDARGAHDRVDTELVRKHLAESEFFCLDL